MQQHKTWPFLCYVSPAHIEKKFPRVTKATNLLDRRDWLGHVVDIGAAGIPIIVLIEMDFWAKLLLSIEEQCVDDATKL